MFSSAFYTKQVTTYDEVKLILQRDPFNLTNEDELNVLCHHLTEQEIQEDNNFANEEEKTYKVDKIKSLFKKTIGYYTIYSPETHIEQFQEIKKYLAEKDKAIRNYFTHDNLQHVDRKKFESFMKINDAVLDPCLLDFLYQVNYESTKSPNFLNFEYVFNQFSLQVPPQQPPSNAYFNNEEDNPTNYFHQSTNAQKINEIQHNDGNSSQNQINQDNYYNNHTQVDKKLTDLKKLQSQEPESYNNTPRETANKSNLHNNSSSKNVNNNTVDLNIPVTLSMNYQHSQQSEEGERQSGTNSRIQMTKIEEEHQQSPNGQNDRGLTNAKAEKHSSQFKGQHDKEKEIKEESKGQQQQEDYVEEEVEF